MRRMIVLARSQQEKVVTVYADADPTDSSVKFGIWRHVLLQLMLVDSPHFVQLSEGMLPAAARHSFTHRSPSPSSPTQAGRAASRAGLSGAHRLP
jgi:hypothetical protein